MSLDREELGRILSLPDIVSVIIRKRKELCVGRVFVKINAGCESYTLLSMGASLVDTPTNASVVAGEQAMIAAAMDVSIGRMGTADEIANVVVFLSEFCRFLPSIARAFVGLENGQRSACAKRKFL